MAAGGGPVGPFYGKKVSRPRCCTHSPRTPVGKRWATHAGNPAVARSRRYFYESTSSQNGPADGPTDVSGVSRDRSGSSMQELLSPKSTVDAGRRTFSLEQLVEYRPKRRPPVRFHPNPFRECHSDSATKFFSSPNHLIPLMF